MESLQSATGDLSSITLIPHAEPPCISQYQAHERHSRSHLHSIHRRPVIRTRRRQLCDHVLRRGQHALVDLFRLIEQTLLTLDKHLPVAGIADLLASRLTLGAEVVYGVGGRTGRCARGEPGVGGGGVARVALAGSEARGCVSVLCGLMSGFNVTRADDTAERRLGRFERCGMGHTGDKGQNQRPEQHGDAFTRRI
jgi:hypothetical protein